MEIKCVDINMVIIFTKNVLQLSKFNYQFIAKQREERDI